MHWNKTIDKVTINVFGFSRGAAAARHFLTKKNLILLLLRLKKPDNITFNFIGLFDTVASSGIIHINDVGELELNLKGKAKKIIQLAAADEYRSNFKLTDITSSIKAGVGYQLTLPGVHSDIGGGYSEHTNEKRYLGEQMVYNNNETAALAKFDEIKKQYIKEGWYTEQEFVIEKKHSINSSALYTLYGNRKNIPNTYQYIPFEIMKTFAEKYATMQFDIKEINENYSVNKELCSIRNSLYSYAIANDRVNELSVTLAHNELKWLRNHYLHRSNLDDDFAMAGRYIKNIPKRDVLEG